MLMQWTCTIDSEPAVTLDNILVLTTNTNSSINPSLLPGANNLPTGTLFRFIIWQYKIFFLIFGNCFCFYNSLYCGRSVSWRCIMLLPCNNSSRGRYMWNEISCDSACMKWNSSCPPNRRWSSTCTGDCGYHALLLSLLWLSGNASVC